MHCDSKSSETQAVDLVLSFPHLYSTLKKKRGQEKVEQLPFVLLAIHSYFGAFCLDLRGWDSGQNRKKDRGFGE